MHVFVGGRVFSGSPTQILIGMKYLAHGVDDLDLDAYVDWIVQRAAWIDGIRLEVDEGPLASRAGQLIAQMIDHGLAVEEDELDPESQRPTDIWEVAPVA